MNKKLNGQSYWARVVDVSVFQRSRLKTIMGIIVLGLPLFYAYKFAQGIDQDISMMTADAIGFVACVIVSTYLFQNFLLMQWLGNLVQIDGEVEPDRVTENYRNAELKKKNFMRLSTITIPLALGVEAIQSTQFAPYLFVLNQYPQIWLIWALVIMFYVISYVGFAVEVARLINLPSLRDEILDSVRKSKIYQHQIPDILEGTLKPMGTAGLAIGLSMFRYLSA